MQQWLQLPPPCQPCAGPHGPTMCAWMRVTMMHPTSCCSPAPCRSIPRSPWAFLLLCRPHLYPLPATIHSRPAARPPCSVLHVGSQCCHVEGEAAVGPAAVSRQLMGQQRQALPHLLGPALQQGSSSSGPTAASTQMAEDGQTQARRSARQLASRRMHRVCCCVALGQALASAADNMTELQHVLKWCGLCCSCIW